MSGLLGDLFDFDGDGELDYFERAMELEFMTSMEEEEEEEEEEVREEEKDWDMTELEIAGLDPEELEFMDEYERREVLEDAGLDPDDFDF